MTNGPGQTGDAGLRSGQPQLVCAPIQRAGLWLDRFAPRGSPPVGLPAMPPPRSQATEGSTRSDRWPSLGRAASQCIAPMRCRAPRPQGRRPAPCKRRPRLLAARRCWLVRRSPYECLSRAAAAARSSRAPHTGRRPRAAARQPRRTAPALRAAAPEQSATARSPSVCGYC
jgi:hypothetical protein